MDALIQTSDGDLRKAITYLQTSAKLFSPAQPADFDTTMAGTSTGVTVSSIEEIAGVVPSSLITRLLDACGPGRGGLYSRVAPVIEEIVAEGWSAGGIINQVPSSLPTNPSFTSPQYIIADCVRCVRVLCVACVCRQMLMIVT